MSLWKALRPPPANRTKQLFWCLSASETDICNTSGQDRSLNLPHDLSQGGLRQSRGGLNDRGEVFQGLVCRWGKSLLQLCTVVLAQSLQRPPNPARPFLGHKSRCPETSTKSIELLVFGKVGAACMTPLREEKPLWTYPDSASVFEASGLPGNSSCSGDTRRKS